MTPLTEADVAELERLEKLATPRPWWKYRDGVDNYQNHGLVAAGEPLWNGADGEMPEGDTIDFIAALRNAAPQLLAAWRESQAKDAEIARLRGALEKIVETQPAGGFDSEPRSYCIARAALAMEGK